MIMSTIRKGVILAACLTAIGTWTLTSNAATESFKVTLDGKQQVPPVQTAATGTAGAFLAATSLFVPRLK